MPVNDELVDKAVTALSGKYHRDSNLEDLIDFLVVSPLFDAMDGDEIEPVAKAAQQRLPPGRVKSTSGGRLSGGPPNGGRGTAPARHVRKDLAPSAPFRFVTLPDQVVMPERATPLDRPIPDGFCAEIAVEWAAETPLLIGRENGQSGVVEPMRLGASGNYVIPGASLRGMIRSAVEIVAHGRLGSANLHHRYGLRDFEHPTYADRSPVSRVGDVNAGWLTWQGEKGAECWRITPCTWSHVVIDDLLESNLGHWPVHRRQEWIGLSLREKYAALGMLAGATFDFTKTFGFTRVADDNGRKVVRPGGPLKGVPVFANKLPGKDGKKRFEYAFFESTGTPAEVKAEIVATFERLYSKPSKNKPKPDGSWKDLRPTLEGGGRLPVFFVGDLDTQDEGFFFGLTRLFKVPHERSVGALLRESQPHQWPREIRNEKGEVIGYEADFVESLFGYVAEKDDVGLSQGERASPNAVGRRGRVAFSFARLVAGQTPRLSPKPEVRAVMMAPRASFAPFYLRSPGEKDYSADDGKPLKLAGRKRYLPRHETGHMDAALTAIRDMGERQVQLVQQGQGGRPVKDDVLTRMRFLLPDGKPDLRFSSTIRLHNVTAAELGAVLFALTHGGDCEKPYRHMIGRARPFGAGQLRVASARLSVEANSGTSDLIKEPKGEEVTTGDGRRGFCPSGEEPAERNASHKPFLNAFRDFMRGQAGLAAFPDVPALREFLAAADPTETTGLATGLDYLPLRDFNDFRKAVKPLKPANKGGAAAPPHKFAQDKDGRLLPAPVSKRQLPS